MNRASQTRSRTCDPADRHVPQQDALSPLSRRRDLLALILLVILTVIIFRTVFLNPDKMFWSRDILRAHCEYKFVQWNSLWKWHQWPLWDPTAYCGKSITGDPLPGTLYPPSWIFWLIPKLTMFGFFLWFQVALGAIGMYAYGRRKGCNSFGALLAACTFALSGKMASHMFAGHVELVSTLLGLPWMLWAVEGILQKPTWQRGVAFGLISTITATCGSVQMMYWHFLFIFAYVLVATLPGIMRRPIAETLRPWRYFALAAIVFVTVGAVWWFPIVRQTSMLGARMTEADFFFSSFSSPKWSDLIRLIWPYYGIPLPVIFESDAYHKFAWETASYPGLVALGLAFMAPFCLKDKKTAIGLSGLAVLVFLLAMGKHSPVFWLAWKFIPGFGLFRCPGRMFFYVSFLIAILAGLMLTHAHALKRKWVVPLAFATAFAGILIASMVIASKPVNPVSAHFWVPAIVLGAAVVVSALWAVRALPASIMAGAVLLIVAGDLTMAWKHNVVVAPVDEAIPVFPSAHFLYKQRQSGEFRVYDPTYIVQPHIAALYGLEVITGYHPAIYKRHLDLYRRMWKDDKSDIIQQYMHRIDEVASPVILDLMNLKYFVDFGRPQSNNYREVYRFMHPRGQCFVYERKSVLPRAFVVARAQLPPPGTTVLDALPLINPKEYCLVEDEPFEGAAAYQPLDIERDGPADITMKFTITQPGVAVISQSWHPDWCATDNGQPVKVRCVNHNFVGVALPPGEHTLRVWYRPWDFYVGLGVSVLGILTIALVTVLAHHRKRSTADQTVTVSIGAS